MVAGARTIDLGITRVAWVTTIAAPPNTVTATEVNAGVDLTPFLLTDYSLGMGGAKSVNEMGIGDLADINVPTIATYTGSLHMFRSLLASGVPGTDDPGLTFTTVGQIGYLVRRIGPLRTVTFTIGDKVEVYKFAADAPAYTGGTGSGFVKMTVPLFNLGVFSLSTTLT